MIIIIEKWKKKLFGLVTAMVLIIAFAIAIPMLSGILYDKVPVFSGWFQEEHPSGNPMRVENTQDGTRFDKAVDQFVIKLQDFYYDEKN
ncbi:MAG: hypothetical protein ABFC94_00525 [Syntrophomonas sp.]